MLSKDNYEVMRSFEVEDIPNLDVCILGALEFLSEKDLPKINIGKKGRLLVIGSGNALVAGRIMFEDRDAVFASESDYRKRFRAGKYNFVILISASGGKNSVGIAKYFKRKRVDVILLTNNKEAVSAGLVSESVVFPKMREPYTYNTSTYLSMILAATKESPEKIYDEINKIRGKIPNDFSKYDVFYFILPSKFDAIRELFTTKFDELFGPEVDGMIFTEEQTKHAKTIVTSNKQLFVGFGMKNNRYGKKRFNFGLPKTADYGMVMAVGYFLIGKIQEEKEPFFKKNIVRYTEEASKFFGEKISPIVEGGVYGIE